jgi:putative flippase GtrA
MTGPDPHETGDGDRPSLAAHGAGFLVSGVIAFTVDALVLLLMTKVLGLGPFVGRLIAICVALVASWQCHRRLTFVVKQRATLSEFLAFAAVAWTSAAVNYSIYSLILLGWPGTQPVVALFLASLIAMFVSYAGYRFGVFGAPGSR